MKRIESAANPQFVQLGKLASQPRARREMGRTLLEGLHLVQEYDRLKLNAAWTLVVSEHAVERPHCSQFLSQANPAEVIIISDKLFAKVSSGEGDNALLAVVNVDALMARRPLPSSGFQLWLDRVQDPGNVGTIIRTAAAAGANAVRLSVGCADAWSPKCLRAAMGGHFHLSIAEECDLAAAVRGFDGEVCVAHAHESAQSVFAVDLRGSMAVIVGNEGEGVAKGLREVARRFVRIPMIGVAESLNVSAAAAVIAFERVRQLNAR